MADPNVGDVFLVSFNQTLLGQKLISTFYLKITNLNGSFPTLDTASNDLYTAISAANQLRDKFLITIPTNCFLDNTTIQRIYPIRQRKRTYGVSTPGGGLGAAEASNVQASIERRDDLANRKSVGALHPVVPPIPTTVIVGNAFSAAQQTSLNALAAKMFGTVNAGAAPVVWTFVLYHKSTVPPSTTDIVTAFPQPTVRVMRRRTAGVGK